MPTAVARGDGATVAPLIDVPEVAAEDEGDGDGDDDGVFGHRT
jgi:hypothetical protein